MTRRLEGKRAIVTGAGTGIGEAVAHKFAREGAKVVVAGLPAELVEDVAGAIRARGGEAHAHPGDLTREDVASACVRLAAERLGGLDVLVNNAGVFLETAELQDYPADKFDETVLNNTRPVFLMTKYALPHLRKRKGTVLFTGSEAGDMGEPNNTPYGGTKAFIHAFMEGVALEQGRYGVRANVVAPGPIDTAWTHHDSRPMTRKMEKQTVQGTILGRRGTCEEVANVFAFLASDEASYVTGSVYMVDGGTTLSKGAFGAEAKWSVRREPEGELELEHSRDGLADKPYESRM